MAGSQAQTVNYYYKQDTNQILVGSGDGSITTVAGMNALITSSKDPALTDIYTVARIKSLGQAVTYQSKAVYNSASDGTGFTINIEDDQELWVYRGIQPPNTVPNGTPSDAGPGDSNHTQYNAYLHRPYKLYMLTETGSGVGTFPWLPFGEFYNESTGQGTNNPNFNNKFDVKQQGIVGNLDYPNNNFLVSESINSGSFTVLQDHREVHPWVYTKYDTLSAPPAVGSFWKIYAERSDTANFGSQIDFLGTWDTATGGGDPGPGASAASNNSSATSVTEIYLDRIAWTTATGTATSPVGLMSSVSQSGIDGKPMGQVILSSGTGFTAASAKYSIISISGSTPMSDFITLEVNTPDIAGTWPPANGAAISMSLNGPVFMGSIQQQQSTFFNLLPEFSNIKLKNSLYSFTSSDFDVSGADGSAASGSCQFGLWAEYDDYVEYKATVDSLNSATVRIDYTGSDGLPKFSNINPGFNATFVAAVGTPSASNDDSSSTFSLEIVSNTATGAAPSNVFSTRISDVYLSLSSSLSQSIDGLYIFNQLPSDDIYVTASMLLNAWTGSDPGSPKYGIKGAEYAISPSDPKYGEGEAGDGTSWPTASINIYKGNYPLNVPVEADTPLHTEQFVTLDGDYGNNGVAITTSFVLPSQSITFQDCLNMSLSVTSGSSPASMVENSLVVSEYQLEFNNAASQEDGDGRVPTFIDNAFKGTGGFSNAPECQPTLNNVVQERNNDKIQLVEYSTDPYDPSNFQRILSGTAARSTVPSSNYAQEPWLNPRYLGSQTTAFGYNTIDGLEGGFGKSPVIEYKRAYLAYCDQVTDPYPVVNSKTQFNLLYMINPGGDALNPLISPYTAYDVLGTWDEGGLGQVGINQVSGSTQFDQLNGYQTTFKVGKQAIPLLYSQTSANTFADAIPIAGNAEQVSNVTSSFIEYDMSSQGSSKVAQYQGANNVTYFNIAQGIADQQGQIMPQTPGTFQASQFNFETGSGFAVQRGNPDKDGVVELPIITASINSYTPPTNVFGTEYAGNPGEIFFTTDPLGSGSGDLSDDYMIRGTFILPASPPTRYKTKKFIKKRNKKKTKWNKRTVGSLRMKFQSCDNLDANVIAENAWTNEKFDWLSDNSPTGKQEPTMTFYFGTTPGTPNGTEKSYFLSQLSDNVSWNQQHTEFTFAVEANDIENYVSNNGDPYNTVQFVTYDFAFQSDISLKSDRRYRFFVAGEYDQENTTQTGEPQRNVFNPINVSIHGDGATGGTVANPLPFTTTFPSDGPYVSMNVVGNQVASSLQSNALNFPYWDFVTEQGSVSNAFEYYPNASDPDNNSYPYLVDSAQNPGVGRIFFTKASGSVNENPALNFIDIANVGSVTVTNNALENLTPTSTTGKGDFSELSFDIGTNNLGTAIATIEETIPFSNLTVGGFVPGDKIVFSILDLETAGFGTVSADLELTLTDAFILQNQKGSNQLSISKTNNFGTTTIGTYLDRIIAIGSGNDQGKIQIVSNVNQFLQITGSITNVTDSGTFYTVDMFNDLTNGGNTSGNAFFENPFLSGQSYPLTISFTTGSLPADVLLENTVIELSSSNGNNNYGLGYYQGYLPYTASTNPMFPGGFEPQDTAWPLPNVPYKFQINDEIRFQNDERFAYKIIKVLSPEQNFMESGRNKLQLTVDKPIQASVDLNFFLIRRYISAPNSVLINRPFPYGSLPTVKEFVPSGNNILTYNDASGPSTGANATGSTSIIEQSGSFIEYIKPLLKRDNTPTGILKPEFPVVEIDVTPDEVVRDLRDKKLIE